MTEEQAKYWREGYECGVKKVLQDNKTALKIGEAILDVLDDRYQLVEEDY